MCVVVSFCPYRSKTNEIYSFQKFFQTLKHLLPLKPPYAACADQYRTAKNVQFYLGFTLSVKIQQERGSHEFAISVSRYFCTMKVYLYELLRA